MSGGLRILIILIVMFIGIYFYSISYRYIRAAKEKKRKKEILNKEETFRQGKMKSQKDREEKAWNAELRRKEIKRQFKWLKGINKDIKRKEETLLDK
ncbi:MAG: hypothetical protein IIC74_01885 [Bacteroidetes bacterium]|nr:hypothetical protein [Bacteroidota bacterium]